MGTLNSMKVECSPLGVPTQDQFTIQSLHSAHSSRSDLKVYSMEIKECETVIMKEVWMLVEAQTYLHGGGGACSFRSHPEMSRRVGQNLWKKPCTSGCLLPCTYSEGDLGHREAPKRLFEIEIWRS